MYAKDIRRTWLLPSKADSGSCSLSELQTHLSCHEEDDEEVIMVMKMEMMSMMWCSDDGDEEEEDDNHRV